MATPNISNLNNRTAAILKVVGMYLAAILLLFLIFISNSKIPEEEYRELKKNYAKVSKKDSLRSNLFVYLDTLTTLTNTLVNLDSIDRVNPSSVIGPINSATFNLDYYVRLLFGEIPNQKLIKEEGKIVQDAYTLMFKEREGLKRLRVRSNTSLETQEDLCETEKKLLETEMETLRAQNAQLQLENNILKTVKVEGGNPAAAADCSKYIEQISILTQKAAKASTQLEALKSRMQAFEDSKGPLANREQLVLSAINEIGQAAALLN